MVRQWSGGTFSQGWGMGQRDHLQPVGDMPASFEGTASTDSYNPDGFYVRSVDGHGHSDWVKERAHPTVTAEIRRLIATGELGGTPINSMGAFMRDALYHECVRIKKLVSDDAFHEFVETQRQLARADAINADRASKVEMIERAKGGLDNAINVGDVSNVLELVELYEGLIDGLREPYRAMLEGELKDARAWLKRVRVPE